jgi:hypothetical protein
MRRAQKKDKRNIKSAGNTVWFADQTFNVHEELKLKVLENFKEIL